MYLMCFENWSRKFYHKKFFKKTDPELLAHLNKMDQE